MSVSSESSAMPYTVVVPTLGRPSLRRLLASLDVQAGPAPAEVVIVDDRRGGPLPPLRLDSVVTSNVTSNRDGHSAAGVTWEQVTGGVVAGCGQTAPAPPLRVIRSGGRGPAAARNAGWARTWAPWVVFLDDDVELPTGWASALAADLDVPVDVGGVQGRIVVPRPARRRPTDWERTTTGLEAARWATADMAYRRQALEAVCGFDERFPRAFREDADLALRVIAAGFTLRRGRRHVVHPVRPTSPWQSLRAQAGNADDALMRRLHGPRWRERSGAHVGRRRSHMLTSAVAVLGVVGLLLGVRSWGAAAGLAWVVSTARFAWARISPGPRTPGEVLRMLATSVCIPPAASGHWVRGWWAARRAAPWPVSPRAVLFDRDGTLVHDVPYNADPDRVRPVNGAAVALARLRAAGVRTGVVTNQSGVARGLLSSAQLRAVNARVEELLGPFDVWQVCPHAEAAACRCRKPAPGMVLTAARALRVAPRDCVVIGDIGRDIEAAAAAGARSVLVPTPATRTEEVAAAALVAPSLEAAVDLLLRPTTAPPTRTSEARTLGARPSGGPTLGARPSGTRRLGARTWGAGTVPARAGSGPRP